MNKLPLFITLICAALLLQACKGVVKDHTDTDSISAADSMKAVTDTSKMHMPLTKEEIQFVDDVTSKALTEVELGKLAQQRGKNKRVKNFGTMMYKDISNAITRLNLIAQHKHVTLPTAPLQVDKDTIDKLSKLSGRAFDDAYANFLIAGHRRYIVIFENIEQNTSDPEVKLFAKKTLVPIKNHLDAMITIRSSMK